MVKIMPRHSFSADPRPFATPLGIDEVFRPTRVVFRHAENKKLTARLFSTEARAFDFAAQQDEVVVVQDARETPPQQDFPIFRSFATIAHRRGPTRPATQPRRPS